MITEKKTAEELVRNIRRKTRRKYSAKEKVSIVLEWLKGERTGADLWRWEGINQNLCYKWYQEY